MLEEKTRYHFDNTYMDEPLKFDGINLIQIGRRYCEAGCLIAAHAHLNWFELTIVTAGTAEVSTDGETCVMSPGDIYLSFPCDIHEIRAPENSKLEYDYFSFFCENRFYDSLELMSRSCRDPGSRSFRDDKISALVGYALSEFTSEQEFSKEALSCIFNQIIVYLIRDFSSRSRKTADISDAGILCLQVMNYIDTHLYTLPGLGELAGDFSYNYSYLSALFRKTTGKKLSEYYRDRRMAAARALLSENQKSVGEISQMLRYSSPFAFSRAFKAKFGCSPKEFEKSSDKCENLRRGT